MKILMINGTMRRGKSYILGRMLIERIAKEEDVVDELFLPKDMPEFCRGCGLCIRQGETKCPDYLIYLRRITKMMDEADLLVFTTPVFVFHASGQMKAFLDHYGYRWMVHRPAAAMFRKQAVCVTTAAGAGMRSTLKDITDSLYWWGVARVYKCGAAVPVSSWDEADQALQDQIKEKLEKISSKIIRDPQKVRPSLRAKMLFYFMRIFQKRKEKEDIDQRYWAERGWLGRKCPWKET